MSNRSTCTVCGRKRARKFLIDLSLIDEPTRWTCSTFTAKGGFNPILINNINYNLHPCIVQALEIDSIDILNKINRLNQRLGFVWFKDAFYQAKNVSPELTKLLQIIKLSEHV